MHFSRNTHKEHNRNINGIIVNRGPQRTDVISVIELHIGVYMLYSKIQPLESLLLADFL